MPQRFVKDIAMINDTGQFGAHVPGPNTQRGHCPNKGSTPWAVPELTLSHSTT